jgi:protein disulfide-isomerase
LPSRTSILETIPLVISNSSKLKSRSTVGFFEATIFHTKSFIVNHPIISLILFVALAVAATISYRKRNARRAGPGGSGGILGVGNSSSGFFKLDGKEGLLNGGSTGKVD